eukprot:TRINITY_DN2258_c0_g2_i1.p1 TRINITY_DN2258_c0_g2~~TRINITY_DN2258_c0_g2_i1.p1  ORF type:complete len:2879 (+),score=515.85 TRINITY_DN2258_c0_g2_i1:196-8637(+)
MKLVDLAVASAPEADPDDDTVGFAPDAEEELEELVVEEQESDTSGMVVPGYVILPVVALLAEAAEKGWMSEEQRALLEKALKALPSVAGSGNGSMIGLMVEAASIEANTNKLYKLALQHLLYCCKNGTSVMLPRVLKVVHSILLATTSKMYNHASNVATLVDLLRDTLDTTTDTALAQLSVNILLLLLLKTFSPLGTLCQAAVKFAGLTVQPGEWLRTVFSRLCPSNAIFNEWETSPTFGIDVADGSIVCTTKVQHEGKEITWVSKTSLSDHTVQCTLLPQGHYLASCVFKGHVYLLHHKEAGAPLLATVVSCADLSVVLLDAPVPTSAKVAGIPKLAVERATSRLLLLTALAEETLVCDTLELTFTDEKLAAFSLMASKEVTVKYLRRRPFIDRVFEMDSSRCDKWFAAVTEANFVRVTGSLVTLAHVRGCDAISVVAVDMTTAAVLPKITLASPGLSLAALDTAADQAATLLPVFNLADESASLPLDALCCLLCNFAARGATVMHNINASAAASAASCFASCVGNLPQWANNSLLLAYSTAVLLRTNTFIPLMSRGMRASGARKLAAMSIPPGCTIGSLVLTLRARLCYDRTGTARHLLGHSCGEVVPALLVLSRRERVVSHLVLAEGDSDREEHHVVLRDACVLAAESHEKATSSLLRFLGRISAFEAVTQLKIGSFPSLFAVATTTLAIRGPAAVFDLVDAFISSVHVPHLCDNAQQFLRFAARILTEKTGDSRYAVRLLDLFAANFVASGCDGFLLKLMERVVRFYNTVHDSTHAQLAGPAEWLSWRPLRDGVPVEAFLVAVQRDPAALAEARRRLRFVHELAGATGAGGALHAAVRQCVTASLPLAGAGGTVLDSAEASAVACFVLHLDLLPEALALSDYIGSATQPTQLAASDVPPALVAVWRAGYSVRRWLLQRQQGGLHAEADNLMTKAKLLLSIVPASWDERDGGASSARGEQDKKKFSRSSSELHCAPSHHSTPIREDRKAMLARHSSVLVLPAEPTFGCRRRGWAETEEKVRAEAKERFAQWHALRSEIRRGTAGSPASESGGQATARIAAFLQSSFPQDQLVRARDTYTKHAELALHIIDWASRLLSNASVSAECKVQLAELLCVSLVKDNQWKPFFTLCGSSLSERLITAVRDLIPLAVDARSDKCLAVLCTLPLRGADYLQLWTSGVFFKVHSVLCDHAGCGGEGAYSVLVSRVLSQPECDSLETLSSFLGEWLSAKLHKFAAHAASTAYSAHTEAGDDAEHDVLWSLTALSALSCVLPTSKVFTPLISLLADLLWLPLFLHVELLLYTLRNVLPHQIPSEALLNILVTHSADEVYSTSSLTGTASDITPPNINVQPPCYITNSETGNKPDEKEDKVVTQDDGNHAAGEADDSTGTAKKGKGCHFEELLRPFLDQTSSAFSASLCVAAPAGESASDSGGSSDSESGSDNGSESDEDNHADVGHAGKKYPWSSAETEFPVGTTWRLSGAATHVLACLCVRLLRLLSFAPAWQPALLDVLRAALDAGSACLQASAPTRCTGRGAVRLLAALAVLGGAPLGDEYVRTLIVGDYINPDDDPLGALTSCENPDAGAAVPAPCCPDLVATLSTELCSALRLVVRHVLPALPAVPVDARDLAAFRLAAAAASALTSLREAGAAVVAPAELLARTPFAAGTPPDCLLRGFCPDVPDVCKRTIYVSRLHDFARSFHASQVPFSPYRRCAGHCPTCFSPRFSSEGAVFCSANTVELKLHNLAALDMPCAVFVTANCPIRKSFYYEVYLLTHVDNKRVTTVFGFAQNCPGQAADGTPRNFVAVHGITATGRLAVLNVAEKTLNLSDSAVEGFALPRLGVIGCAWDADKQEISALHGERGCSAAIATLGAAGSDVAVWPVVAFFVTDVDSDSVVTVAANFGSHPYAHDFLGWTQPPQQALCSSTDVTGGAIIGGAAACKPVLAAGMVVRYPDLGFCGRVVTSGNGRVLLESAAHRWWATAPECKLPEHYHCCFIDLSYTNTLWQLSRYYAAEIAQARHLLITRHSFSVLLQPGAIEGFLENVSVQGGRTAKAQLKHQLVLALRFATTPPTEIAAPLQAPAKRRKVGAPKEATPKEALDQFLAAFLSLPKHPTKYFFSAMRYALLCAPAQQLMELPGIVKTVVAFAAEVSKGDDWALQCHAFTAAVCGLRALPQSVVANWDEHAWGAFAAARQLVVDTWCGDGLCTLLDHDHGNVWITELPSNDVEGQVCKRAELKTTKLILEFLCLADRMLCHECPHESLRPAYTSDKKDLYDAVRKLHGLRQLVWLTDGGSKYQPVPREFVERMWRDSAFCFTWETPHPLPPLQAGSTRTVRVHFPGAVSLRLSFDPRLELPTPARLMLQFGDPANGCNHSRPLRADEHNPVKFQESDALGFRVVSDLEPEDPSSCWGAWLSVSPVYPTDAVLPAVDIPAELLAGRGAQDKCEWRACLAEAVQLLERCANCFPLKAIRPKLMLRKLKKNTAKYPHLGRLSDEAQQLFRISCVLCVNTTVQKAAPLALLRLSSVAGLVSTEMNTTSGELMKELAWLLIPEVKNVIFQGIVRLMKKSSHDQICVRRHNPVPLTLQVFRALRSVHPENLRAELRVKLIGEHAIDRGGPLREVFAGVSAELTCGPDQSAAQKGEDLLPLFILCPNAKLASEEVGIGLNRDKYIPRSGATASRQLQLFCMIGKLMANCVLTGKSMFCMNLAPVFWKQLLGKSMTKQDLRSIDQFCYQCLEDIGNAEQKGVTEDTFSDTFDLNSFTITLSDGMEKVMQKQSISHLLKGTCSWRRPNSCHLGNAAEISGTLLRGKA